MYNICEEPSIKKLKVVKNSKNYNHLKLLYNGKSTNRSSKEKELKQH